MASYNSFDVVSKIEMPEVVNAISQALKEVLARYDLKDSKSTIELNEKDLKIILASADDYKIKAVNDILQSKMLKRGVPIRNLDYGPVLPAAGSTVRQEVKLKQGLETEKAKLVVKAIKDSKLKATPSIMGDYIRVASKDRDTLQQVIALLRGEDFGVELQFTNYR